MGSASAGRRRFDKRRARRHGAALALVLAAVAGLAGGAPAQAQTHDPSAGPGGPILVIADPADPYGRYYAEILRAEGLNAFTVTSTGAVSAQTLAAHQVAILAGGATLGDAQVGALTEWVHAGGNLVAMRPRANLAPLLGLGADSGDLREGYIKIDTGAAPGAGLTGATMQFHGVADLWSAAGATSVAALYSGADTATSSPAVTLRSVGAAGGQAAAFTYDLARSVVQTRQGNPGWAKQKRDNSTRSIRPVDLFYGGVEWDMQPDWVNRDKVAIPQADEQQRLLANLVTTMNADRAPLPRFWYLPRGERAAVVMTGDDHRIANTPSQFDKFKAASPAGCSVADWECIRSTSYLVTGTPLTSAALDAYEAQGFEIALHLALPVDLSCNDFTPETLEAAWQQQLTDFSSAWPALSPPRTNRTHCITWSDWASMPHAELRHGVRFDTNYYYANNHWVQGRPGMFTGSGFPMRFADLDGSIIDVYQATTQLNDESAMDVSIHVAALLDGALGPNGYYGVFTANMHTDYASHEGADAIVAAAKARGVPIVSSVQMLEWLDGRNASSFQGFSSDGGRVRFRIARAAGARGLEAMVPASSAHGALLGLTADGAPVSTTPRTVKGVEYAVFDAAPAEYVATYPAPPPVPPAAGGTAPGGAVAGSGSGGGGKGTGGGSGAGSGTLVLRATRRGYVTLPVTCRRTARACRTTVRLKHRGRTVALKTVRIGARKRARVTLRLSRATRQQLARRGSLVLTATITGAGSRTTTQRVRVRAAG